MRYLTVPGIGLALLLTAVPAAAQLSAVGRVCGPAEVPKTLPGVDQLVDSASLAASARAALGANPAVDVILGLRGSRTGIDSTWLVSAEPGGPLADSLTALAQRASWRPA